MNLNMAKIAAHIMCLKSFQQLYGPEANFSYRAHTADEILSDVKKLREMIRDHYEKQCPRLAALDDYMKATEYCDL